MNKAFEKIIDKLEEIRAKKTCNKEKCDTKELCRICVVDDAIEIVKQEAEQYNNAIIDGKYCFQSCACTEKCDKCSRLRNGDIDWYENIDNWTEEYNNGWIPCSERLPEEAFGCLVTVMDCEPSTQTDFENILPYFVGYDGDSWNDADGEEIPFEVLAWRKLPLPYQPKGE